MQNKDFFENTSIVSAPPSTAIAPYSQGQINSAMLLAAADRPTKLRLTQAILSDQCRALLAVNAIENTMMLSIMEAHLTQTAPHAEQRFKAIADAYVVGAIEKIRRW